MASTGAVIPAGVGVPGPCPAQADGEHDWDGPSVTRKEERFNVVRVNCAACSAHWIWSTTKAGLPISAPVLA